MLRELALIVPLGFAAALSPMMLAEQTVLLAGPDGPRVAQRFASGTALVTVVYVGVLVAWGHAVSLPKRPTLSASMDIAVGAMLVLLAVGIQRHPQRQSDRPIRSVMGPTAALGFGAFSMATNFTSLALLLPAAKDIAAGAPALAARITLGVVLVVLATMPAWIPIATTRVAPGSAERALDWLSNLISKHGRSLVVTLIFAFGVVLVCRGALIILT